MIIALSGQGLTHISTGYFWLLSGEGLTHISTGLVLAYAMAVNWNDFADALFEATCDGIDDTNRAQESHVLYPTTQSPTSDGNYICLKDLKRNKKAIFAWLEVLLGVLYIYVYIPRDWEWAGHMAGHMAKISRAMTS